MKAPKGKWLLHVGVHAGTVMSRRFENPIEHNSEVAAREQFAAIKEYVDNRNGCYFWFACLYDDQGNKTELTTPVPYSQGW